MTFTMLSKATTPPSPRLDGSRLSPLLPANGSPSGPREISSFTGTAANAARRRPIGMVTPATTSTATSAARKGRSGAVSRPTATPDGPSRGRGTDRPEPPSGRSPSSDGEQVGTGRPEEPDRHQRRAQESHPRHHEQQGPVIGEARLLLSIKVKLNCDLSVHGKLDDSAGHVHHAGVLDLQLRRC